MGTYRITRKLGAGTLVEGYVGALKNGAGAEQPVWLKRLTSPWSREAGFVERFQRLATQWRYTPAGVLAPLVEFGPGADQLWVAQGLTEGEPLRAVLAACAARQVRPAPNEMTAICLRAAAGLATLHEASVPVFHGDVCASTIHLTSKGQVLFTDFGIATASGVNAAAGPARSEAPVLAPEQAGGSWGPPADVYRLGLVLLELVTGRSALPTGPVAGVPEKLGSLLMWMLTKDPGNRPQAREVENALQLAADEGGWSVADADVARFIARSMPDRVALTAIPPSGGSELVIKGVAIVPLSTLEPKPPTPSAPGGPPVTLARIAPRRMTAEALAAVKATEAEEAAAKAPPVEPWRDTKVADHLVAQKKVSAEQVQEALAQAQRAQMSVNDALVAVGAIEEDDLVSAMGELTKTTSISSKRLAEMKPVPEALALVSEAKAEALQVVPLALKNGTQLMVAMRDPLNAATVEEVKRLTGHTTFIAVRAGPRALHRTLGRFYRGIDEDDPSSWLEMGANVVSGEPLDAGAGLELDAGPGEMQLDLRGDLPTAEKLNATLDEPQLKLFEAGLGLMGDAGQQVVQFVRLAGGVAKRLNVSDAELGRVRYAASAMALINLGTRRPVWEPTRVETLAALASRGWRSIEELVTRAFEVNKPPPSDVAALALQATLVFCALSGAVKPTGPALATALQGLAGRKYPRVAVEAVRVECGG